MTIASPMTLALSTLLLFVTAANLSAQTPNGAAAFTGPSLTSSSLADAPEPPASPSTAAPPMVSRRYPGASTTGFSPSRTIGVSVKLSSGGVGLDLTMPIAPRFALRGGASFLSANGSLVEENVDIAANIKLQNAFAAIDFFPFRSSFRITPGLSFANRTAVNANLSIPGGETFSFGNGGTNFSDPNDPVHGTAQFEFGRGVNPRLTAGWANAIPHRNRRITFPIEIGFEYIAPPTAKLIITGSACDSVTGPTDTNCGPVEQTDVTEEQRELLEDIKPLRIFPILSIGVTYWFGNVRSRE